MDQWFQSGANVRQQHNPLLAPAGVGIELVHEPDGVYLRSMIVEPTAMKLVTAGAYQAYSVGLSQIRKVQDYRAPKGRITGGKVVEVSIVDRPSNPTTKMEICKTEGYRPDAPMIYLGGYDETALAAINADVMKHLTGSPHAHDDLTYHEHTHDDGVVHKHAHLHTAGETHDDHTHRQADVIKLHQPHALHPSPAVHAHQHADGTQHLHDHDHAADRPDHDTHVHAGDGFAKAAPIATHVKASPIHTDTKTHDHTHTKGDRYIAAGDSHAHPHDHAEGDAGHDGHLSQHSALIPDSQKAIQSDVGHDAAVEPSTARLDGAAALAQITGLQATGATATAQLTAVADALKTDVPTTRQTVDAAGAWEWLVDRGGGLYPIARKAAIPHKDGEPQSPPEGYPEDKSQYADPANYAWPLDSDGRVHAAVSYYNAQKGKDKYAADEWHSIGARIAAAATRRFGGEYQLSGDKISTPSEGKEAVPTVVKNGIAATLGPTTLNLLYQALVAEVNEDGGTGTEATDINHIAASYYHYWAYCQGEALESDETMTGGGLALGYAAVPNTLKTLHDLICPATDLTAVKAARPAVAQDVTAAFVAPRQTVHQLLCLALDTDAGQGRAKGALSVLSGLYASLAGVVTQSEPDPGQLQLDLHTALTTVRKQVTDLTDRGTVPDGLPSFRPPSEAVPGAQGREPQRPEAFIRETHNQDEPAAPPQGRVPGMADLHGSDARGGNAADPPRDGIARVASPTLDSQDPPGPDDFRDGPLTAGQQRSLPEQRQVKADAPATAAVTVNGRQYYTNAARDGMVESLRTIHDHLAAMHPEICSVLQGAGDRTKAGAFAQAALHPHVPTRTTALAAPGGFPAQVKTAVPERTAAEAPDSGALSPDVIKALVADAVQAAQAPLLSRIEEQQTVIDRLAAEPDPTQAAYRGTTAVAVERFSHANAAQKSARREELFERGRSLGAWLRAGNADPAGARSLELSTIEEELGTRFR